jgi:POT family proton-dependent oligopeptide transporter
MFHRASRLSNSRYISEPPEVETFPRGVPYIVGNEAAERFSYYGMRAILVVFMTRFLADSSGARAPMSETEARYYYHLFSGSVYFCPLLGAWLADAFFGKYRTIVALSVVYCLGHLALALDDTRVGLAWGLGLIALGSGGIKPCVSAHVGDQFGTRNAHLMTRVFGWFYVSINLGAFISSLLTPWLLENMGPSIAFGVPGVLMLVATIVFWMGRNVFVHVPPNRGKIWAELKSSGAGKNLLKLLPFYVFIALFWSLYDQTGSSWVQQGERMSRRFLGFDWYAAQVQALNPALVLVLVPLFSNVVYPVIGRRWELTAARKIFVGMLLASASFLIPAWVESRISMGEAPTIGWQVGAYVLLTAGEVLVSVTALEFSYTQAPKSLKSFVMSLYLLSVSLGNWLTAGINYAMSGPGEATRLAGAAYYSFFAALMLVGAIGFLVTMRGYRERLVLQVRDAG